MCAAGEGGVREGLGGIRRGGGIGGGVCVEQSGQTEQWEGLPGALVSATES